VAIDVYKEWLGIPEDQRPPDHYQLLRLVQFEDNAEKVQANYRKLNAHVRKYATGQYMDESQALLNELAKAMLCLTDAERKRDYDEQLGREFDDDDEPGALPPIEKILLDQDVISSAQIEEARQMCDNLGIEMRDALVQLKAVKADAAARALATSLGRPFVDLADMIPDDGVLDRVPRSMVKKHSILPLFIDEDDDVLLVAGVNPITADVEDDLRLRFSLPVRDVIAAPLAINQAIAKYYAPGVREEAEEVVESPKAGEGGKKGKAKKAAKKKAAKQKEPTRGDQAREQKQLCIIAFCFSFVIANLLDGFVIDSSTYLDGLSIVGYLVIPAITAAVCYLAFWPRS
tara:strand:+ start:889 stop:1923 length:1035 start_codon:yes stop_codon:yes gene_type:complete